MKHIIDFIKRHKTFFKKAFYFIGFIAVYCLLNNPVITNLFTQVFGEFITPALCASPLMLMIGGE